MDKTNRAAVAVNLQYRSKTGQHNDILYVDKVDFWRDIFPGSMGKALAESGLNEPVTENFEAGQLVPGYDKEFLRTFSKSKFNEEVTPLPGRYYPIGYAWRGFDSFPNTPAPFRLIAQEQNALTGDRNHPLATLPLQLSTEKLSILPEAAQRGGSINDFAELACSNGPGMQLPGGFTFGQTFGQEPLKRLNNDDSSFYIQPRMTQHIDSLAEKHLTAIHNKILRPEMKILDLMAGCHSHLPNSFHKKEITGLGMNMEELQANPMLTSHLTHDLNQNPSLPFDTESFDAVICALSIEYLTRPVTVISEIVRILRPAGTVVISVSDRWFPSKEIALWKDLHPFERMGYIIQLIQTAASFSEIHSESVRGFPRPENDRHYGKTFLSDPIFSVWAHKQN